MLTLVTRAIVWEHSSDERLITAHPPSGLAPPSSDPRARPIVGRVHGPIPSEGTEGPARGSRARAAEAAAILAPGDGDVGADRGRSRSRCRRVSRVLPERSLPSRQRHIGGCRSSATTCERVEFVTGARVTRRVWTTAGHLRGRRSHRMKVVGHDRRRDRSAKRGRLHRPAATAMLVDPRPRRRRLDPPASTTTPTLPTAPPRPAPVIYPAGDRPRRKHRYAAC